jgi:hypothetical protein
LTVRQHLRLAGGATVGAILSWAPGKIGAGHISNRLLSGALMGCMLAGLVLLTMCITYWITSIVTADKAKERGLTLTAQRREILRYLDPDKAALKPPVDEG